MSDINKTKVEPIVVEPIKEQDSSTFREMAKKLTDANKHNKELAVELEQIKTTNSEKETRLDALERLNNENLFGKDNVEEATILLKAGIEVDRVKEMLSMNNSSNEQLPNLDEGLGLKPGNPTGLTEEEKAKKFEDDMNALEILNNK